MWLHPHAQRRRTCSCISTVPLLLVVALIITCSASSCACFSAHVK